MFKNKFSYCVKNLTIFLKAFNTKAVSWLNSFGTVSKNDSSEFRYSQRMTDTPIIDRRAL